MITVLRFHPDRPPSESTDLAASGWRPDASDTIWIDLEAPSDAELELLVDPFHFHPLAIEDCLTHEHQPKIEDFGPYLFLIFRGIDFNPPVERFQTLKLAAFLGPNYLVTYHRRPLRSVSAVRGKHRRAAAATAFRGADYLLYEVLDHVIEFYFPVLETLEDDVQKIEAQLFTTCGPDTLESILTTKRRALEIKRTLAPHRELFGRIGRGEFEEISPHSIVFYRDLYDSTYRLTEMADAFRALLTGTLDAYLSMVSQRLNEVMKVLTIFSTIMLPLTFIVGVYGMNFEVMPELTWKYGYLAVWGVILLVAASLLIFFRRRKWL
ncbi:MAG: magnesium/cobalt transporter CorA [Gemmatimonadota bacterium]